MKQVQTEACRYCGQIVQFEAEGSLTSEQAMEKAVLNCEREDARAYKKCMKQEKKALENVSKLFGEGAEKENQESDGILSLMNAAVIGICNGELEKITLNLPGGIRAAISQGKENIKVERTETKKRQLAG